MASMLGNRLGVNVNIGNTQNACTDGKTIYLPPLPADADERLYCLVNGFRGCPACFLILKGVVISSHETNRFS